MMRLRIRVFRGSTFRCMLLRASVILLVLSVLSLLQILSGVDDKGPDSMTAIACAVKFPFVGPFLFPGARFMRNSIVKPVWGSFESVQCKENVNLTANVVRELMGMQMLNYDAKALCIGEHSASAVSALKEMGFSNAREVYRLPFFSLKYRKLVYELDYGDGSFDLVLSRDLDRVAVPALLVLEIERVLKPGGIGAVVVEASGTMNSNSLIRSATPITSLLKSSIVVHVDYVGEFTLVVFKKKVENRINFERSNLPADCQSVINNKPYMELIEPLFEKNPTEFEKNPTEFEKRIQYLPKFLDVSSKKRLVYINIGAGEHLNSSSEDWFLPNYPADGKAFNAYLVDHNTSVMISHVKRPGVTFVYHPGLAGTTTAIAGPSAWEEDLEPLVEEDSFDFLAWLKETVSYADFVVLKMNSSDVELKFLSDLFNSGTICFVDELLLRCSNRPDCLEIFRSLRSSGIFVHQWWGA